MAGRAHDANMAAGAEAPEAADAFSARDTILAGFSLVAQGAEGRLYSGEFVGKRAVAKERFRKRYRHPQLDTALSLARLTSEARALVRARKLGLRVPQLLFLHAASGLLVLEEIRGVTLKEHIRASAEEEQVRCAREFGRMVAVMHCADMLHGDLTTSNVMVERVEGGEGQLVLIDFGLSETSTSHEDKAVDLYVLERAFDSTHPGQRYLVDACLAGYLDANADAARPVLQRLDNVRSRGRKRVAFG